MTDEAIPEIEPGQIAGDAYYFATCKARKASPLGSRSWLLHNLQDIGQKKPSERWHRVWIKTSEEGWTFQGLQKGLRFNNEGRLKND